MKISIIFFACIICLSCVTTALYGNKFTEVEGEEDTYALKIYFGGPSGGAVNLDFEEGTKKRLVKEAEKYISKNPEYNSYEILASEKNAHPSYYIYKVKFSE